MGRQKMTREGFVACWKAADLGEDAYVEAALDPVPRRQHGAFVLVPLAQVHVGVF